MLSVIMVSVIIVSVIMLRIIKLRVMVPKKQNTNTNSTCAHNNKH
jgi:hypothetical protein